MAVLSTKERKSLPGSAFVFPEKAPGPGSYPIPDVEHGRKALQLGAKFASPAKLATIRSKVHAEFPGIGKQPRRYRAPEEKS